MEQFNDYLGYTTDTSGMPKHLQQTLNEGICYFGGGGRSSTTELDPEIKAAVLPGIEKIAGSYTSGKLDQIADTRPVEAALDRGNTVAAEQGAISDEFTAEARALRGLQGDYGEGRTDTRSLAKDALEGRGVYNRGAAQDAALRDLQGEQRLQSPLNSARAEAARQRGLGQLAGQHQQQRIQDAQSGAQALRGLGQEARGALGQSQGIATTAGQQKAAAAESFLRSQQTRRALGQEIIDRDSGFTGAQKLFGVLGSAPQGSKTTQTGGK